MGYRSPIMQPPYSTMVMGPTVVVQGVPFQQPYYSNFQNQSQTANQNGVIKPQNPNAIENQYEYLARSQMNSLKKLIENGERLRNSNLNTNPSSPFTVRWRCVTDPFPSFWGYEKEHVHKFEENDRIEFSMQNDNNYLNPAYTKINETRSATISPSSQPNNYIPQQPRSQTPQNPIVPTNFVPQRQPSPEIMINSTKIINNSTHDYNNYHTNTNNTNNSTNNHNSIGYQNKGYNSKAGNKKHNTRKRRTPASSQWTYKPGEQ
ncbi:hypothetical protein TRFO_06155 [Tritrichomonas foetus]|uniref:Uncharacterized protein n=1 Tax=Tritrichomonas foetus TaxID=1144522 RepID=A0A1J4K1R5_9EUKA|nr:hypothetical protein TRFO_06155 [Tritrichomonas foetus]|eukprot:OHT04728.1 hypothetical protein TRFO_06155 [Tritrichomonas foetus]